MTKIYHHNIYLDYFRVIRLLLDMYIGDENPFLAT